MRRSERAINIGTIANTLLRFSLPLIFSGILQQLYNWADAFIVGNVEGEAALAAVGATTTIINFYVTVITGFTLGLSILIAQKYGSREVDCICRILSTFSLFLGCVFLIFSAIGLIYTRPLLILLHTTQDTISLAEDYLKIIFIGIPFLAVYNVYCAALRGIGDSKAPFYSVLLSSAVNVILDIVFVAIFQWGVAGAAIATIVSQAAMTVYLVIYSTRRYSILRFWGNRNLFDKKLFRLGCRLGIPPMLQSSVSSVGSLVLQNFMNGFGTQTVAAVTTAYRVDSIVMVPIINFGSGISTLVAQDYGSGQRKHAAKTFLTGSVMMAGISLILTVLIIPTGGNLIALFGAGQQAVAIGRDFFRIIASFYLIFGLATAVRSYLEGMGDVIYSSFAGIVSLLSRIAASYALVSIFSNMVIAYAEAFSWFVLLVLYIARMYWKQQQFKKEQNH